MISQGQFREDLFYRLNVISLCCPALRQRPEDIFELALYFVRLHSQQIEKSITGIDNAALEALARYDWPGNVRQLENAMQRAVIMAQGPRITRGDLPPEVTARRSSMRPGQQETMSRVPARVGANSESEMPEVLLGGARGSSPPVMTSQITGLPDELETLQRQRLIEALQQTGGNKSKAARLLGMPRSTFFSKLRKLGLG
jgi:DNA-binding NtrC family response regulator